MKNSTAKQRGVVFGRKVCIAMTESTSVMQRWFTFSESLNRFIFQGTGNKL